MTDGQGVQTTGSRQHLGMWSTISIIVGIVIGVSIFEVPNLVFGSLSSPGMGLLAWLLGGVLALVGALCYAELAVAYPRSGGDYEYLSRAFHPYAGYLFGWARLTVIQSGSIGALAFVFAKHFGVVIPGIEPVWSAIGIVVLLTGINILGVKEGRIAQNVLTVLKVAGMLAIVVAGLLVGNCNAFVSGGASGGGLAGFGFAMIMVLYAYGGWNEAAFVAAEMKDPRRNIPRALVWSVIIITAIYLLVNVGYLFGLGFGGLAKSGKPAADILQQTLGNAGAVVISLIIVFSALGALNGTILTGSRVYAVMGEDHKIVSMLGRWSQRFGTPVWSLVGQGLIAVLMIFLVGTTAGQQFLDSLLTGLGLSAIPWAKYYGGFSTLVAGTAPIFWLFFLMTGVAVIVLRYRDKGVKREFKVPFFPVLPAIFCLMCLYMLYSSIVYAKGLILFGIVLLAIGVPLYWIGRKKQVTG